MTPHISIIQSIGPSVCQSIDQPVKLPSISLYASSKSRLWSRKISCNHEIMQSFHQHEEATLTFWALFLSPLSAAVAPVVFGRLVPSHWSHPLTESQDSGSCMYSRSHSSNPPIDQSINPEKSRIINSIFLAILDIEGFPFFLGNVWVPSGVAWGLGRNLLSK